MTTLQKEILLKTKKQFFLNLQGEHSSILNGNGLDFREVREYNTDDDIRHINWKVTAKNLTPSVNVFNEDKQLNIVVVLLNSGSMMFGTQKSKQDVGVEVLTLLGLSALYKNDTLTTMFFSNDIETFVKPTKNKSVVEVNFDTAYKEELLGKRVDYKNLNSYLLNKIKKKSLVFLIGDFLEFGDFSSISHKHEVFCTIIRDRQEENLTLSGEFSINDTQTSDSKEITLDKATLKRYNELMKEYDIKLKTHLKKSAVKYIKIYTDDNVIHKLQKLIK